MQRQQSGEQGRPDLFERTRDRFFVMLDTVEDMFGRAVGLLSESNDKSQRYGVVYEMDRRVDAGQQQLRRDLVLHLAVNPRGDAGACLVLMVAAKDAERIGDYCKNLIELTDLIHGSIITTKYGAALRGMFAEVGTLFGPTKKGFANLDQALAERIRARAADIEMRCSAMIQTLANDAELSENHAVCLALAFRGCKRISAHLANIVSAAGGLFQAVPEFHGESAEDCEPVVQESHA